MGDSRGSGLPSSYIKLVLTEKGKVSPDGWATCPCATDRNLWRVRSGMVSQPWAQATGPEVRDALEKKESYLPSDPCHVRAPRARFPVRAGNMEIRVRSGPAWRADGRPQSLVVRQWP